MQTSVNVKKYFQEVREYVNNSFDKFLPESSSFPVEIHEAMRYSLMAGGKRLRPILVIAAAEAVGGSREKVLPTACAIEMIHTYTLIHDDLPALDNDDLRRGMPTSHAKFGEAIAILAGDALLTQAFQIMTDRVLFSECDPWIILKVSNEVATYVGVSGTIGGQVADMLSEGKSPELATLEYIHTHKTGKMILAAIRAGALLSDVCEEDLKLLTEYGECIGLAFQVIDDILDIEGQNEQLGKKTGSDENNAKMTYPSLLGITESRRIAATLVDRALNALKPLGDNGEILKDVAEYIVARSF